VKRWRRLAHWRTAIIAALACDGVASAAPIRSAAICSIEGPQKAEVSIAGDDRGVRLVGESLRESLGKKGIDALITRAPRVDPRDVARPVACEPGVVARIFLDLGSGSTAILYLTDGGGNRVFVRPFAVERGLDIVALESIDLVANSSIEALLSGEELGVRREEYNRSLPPAPPLDRPAKPAEVLPRAFSPRVTGLYEVSLLGPGTVQHGPGIGVEFDWLLGRAGLTVHARFPVHFDDPDIAGRLVPLGVRLFAAHPFDLSDRATLSAGVAAGVDFTRVDATPRQPDTTPIAAFWAVDPLLRAFGSFEHRFGAFRLSAIVGADLDLIAARYVVANGVGRQSVFVPWRVRPLGGVTFGAEL
jgi:hypothetical protein